MLLPRLFDAGRGEPITPLRRLAHDDLPIRPGFYWWWNMTLYQFQSHPKWHERASRSEIREVEDIDRLIADLRKRRQTIINRVHMRTEVWATHHPERKRA
jgi:hypothetical protein